MSCLDNSSVFSELPLIFIRRQQRNSKLIRSHSSGNKLSIIISLLNDEWFCFFPEWYFCTKAIFCQLPHNFWLRSPSERRWAILMDSFPVQFFHRWQNIDKLFLCEIDMSLMFLKIAISTSFSCFSSSRMEIFWMTFYFSFLSFNNWIHWSWNLIIAKQRDLNKRKLLLEVLLTFKIVLFVTEKLQQNEKCQQCTWKWISQLTHTKRTKIAPKTIGQEMARVAISEVGITSKSETHLIQLSELCCFSFLLPYVASDVGSFNCSKHIADLFGLQRSKPEKKQKLTFNKWNAKKCHKMSFELK